MMCKHGHSGGKNLFEVLYCRPYIPLDYNLQRIIVECISYDSDIEADHYEQARTIQNDSNEKYIVRSKKGVRELRSELKMATKYPQYVNAEVTLLTTKEYNSIGKSANYYRDITSARTAR